jgi:hypothetical protein
MHLVWVAVKIYQIVCSEALIYIGEFEERTPQILLKIKFDQHLLANFSVFHQITVLRL